MLIGIVLGVVLGLVLATITLRRALKGRLPADGHALGQRDLRLAAGSGTAYNAAQPPGPISGGAGPPISPAPQGRVSQ